VDLSKVSEDITKVLVTEEQINADSGVTEKVIFKD
jgi:hypothetical protein